MKIETKDTLKAFQFVWARSGTLDRVELLSFVLFKQFAAINYSFYECCHAQNRLNFSVRIVRDKWLTSGARYCIRMILELPNGRIEEITHLFYALCPFHRTKYRERERDCVLVAKVYEGHFVFVSFFWQYLQSYICIVMQLWGFSCYFLYYTNKQIFSVWFKVESHFFRSILNANLLDKPIINSISQNN